MLVSRFPGAVLQASDLTLKFDELKALMEAATAQSKANQKALQEAQIALQESQIAADKRFAEFLSRSAAYRH